MRRASKLSSVLLLLCLQAGAAYGQAAPSAADVTEMQFELARGLAQAGEHELASREFDRALQLQRNAATLTPEQRLAAVEVIREYVRTRPTLPRMAQIRRRLGPVDARNRPARAAAARSAAAPAPRPAAAPASQTPAPGIAPVPPPSPPGAPNSRAPSARATASYASRPPAPGIGLRLRAPVVAPVRMSNNPWWEQVLISADELLIPEEWRSAVLMAQARGGWPQLVAGWPELLVPEGWDRPTGSLGFSAMLFIDSELLIPPGW